MHSAQLSRHLAVVILNYESEEDLRVCAEQLSRQEGVRLSLILVDNGSRSESRASLRSWLSAWRPDAACGSPEQVRAWVDGHPSLTHRSGAVYLVENPHNRGYSAGNNVGLRLAAALGAEAVLVANPDMRIEDRHYVAQLASHLFAEPRRFVAASRVVGLDGRDQNPQREATFLEELLWPRWLLPRALRPSYLLACPADRASAVPKVSGCCMMLRTSFLEDAGFLDENVFLYSEEPILSARVRAANGTIVYVPTVSAIHAHVRGRKGNGARRMRMFIESRRYYLARYSGHERWKLRLLSASYFVLGLYSMLRGGRRP